MNFRHFIMTGLMVGAALLLPNMAFAEKNENSVKARADSVQPIDPVKMETAAPAHSSASVQAQNAKLVEKEKSLPEPALNIQNEPGQPIPSQPQAAGLQNLPEQAKADENAKPISVEKVTGPEKATAVQDKEKADVYQKTAAENANVAKYNSHAKNKMQASKEVTSFEPVQMEASANSGVVEPVQMEPITNSYEDEPQKQGSAPVGEEKLPKVDQALNSTQRTNQSGGQSNDRVNHGLTLLMIDKWFEWKKYDENHLVQLYFLRQEFLNNQWVNAPPAPPPKKCSFLQIGNL